MNKPEALLSPAALPHHHPPGGMVFAGRLSSNAWCPDQKIYYIMGDDEHSVLYSPHLDVVHHYDYEVLLFTDPVDAFMLVRLDKYQDHPLVNVATANLELPDGKERMAKQPAGTARSRANA